MNYNKKGHCTALLAQQQFCQYYREITSDRFCMWHDLDCDRCYSEEAKSYEHPDHQKE